MRLGLDLRPITDPERRQGLAIEADRLGLWAVLVGGAGHLDGTAAVEAAALATVTDHLHLALWLSTNSAHPLALAEEVAIVDHLSDRRAMTVVDGPPEAVDQVDRYLAGHLVDGVALTPPPAQTRVPVWSAADCEPVALTGDPDRDRATIDQLRDGGATHRFVTWPASVPLAVLARHLVTRAAAPGFPQVVADLADVVQPIDAPTGPADRP